MKTRWPDGSVQHAVVSFWAEVGRGKSIAADFVDQPVGNNAGFLTKSQILDPTTGWAGNLGAQIVATQGPTQTADIRTFLTNWNESVPGEVGRGVRYWLKGPIVTQLIVEGGTDYDFGWDCSTKDSPCSGSWSAAAQLEQRSLHPIYVLTIYPGWPAVKIETILESSWTTKLKDQNYSVDIRLGNPLAAASVYSKAVFDHHAGTRWRKVFWSGTAPGKVNVDYNLPYLVYSRILPSYDLTKKVPSEDIQREVTAFQAGDRGDLGGAAQWQRAMPTAGGRGDIGLFPRWYVRYLYTFNSDLYEVMLGDAAVSGYTPIHYRESLTGRPYDSAHTVEAFGRPLSVDARPTVRTTNQSQDSKPQDVMAPVGPVSAGKWNVDLAHQPSFAFIPYVITGDWYYLEELYFWASYNVAHGNPGTTQSYNRHADWGFINDDQEIRGVAWGMRNLAHAALAAPDGTPEKAYFTEKLNNSIAIREGKYNITEGEFYQSCQTSPYSAARETSKWCWGRNTVAGGKDNPLVFLEPGNPGLTQGLDTTKVYAGSSPWMLNFNHIVLGHLRELGFPVAKLQTTLAKNLLNQIVNRAYNPYLVGSYRIPVLSQPGQAFLGTWADVKAGFEDPNVSAFRDADARDVEHGYVHIAQAAASFLAGISDGYMSGQEAWDWVSRNVGYQSFLNSNPKWALVPREPTPNRNVPLRARAGTH